MSRQNLARSKLHCFIGGWGIGTCNQFLKEVLAPSMQRRNAHEKYLDKIVLASKMVPIYGAVFRISEFVFFFDVIVEPSEKEWGTMQQIVEQLWPEIEWIQAAGLREQVAKTWALALERSPLKSKELQSIPFTLLIKDCRTTFMDHKRCVVHIARRGAEAMQEFMGSTLSIDMDTVIAGAILADVGKLLEYEIGPDGRSGQSSMGQALRHPFTGVALALECGVPAAVCHVIAAHAAEGGLVNRSPEAWIVHHADFMAFDPFKSAPSTSK
jgi:hypothetical protein